MDELPNVPELSLKALKLRPPADTHDLMDPHGAATQEKHVKVWWNVSAEHFGCFFCSEEEPVLLQNGDVLAGKAVEREGLDAAPESPVLSHAGRLGAPQSHLTNVQNISD